MVVPLEMERLGDECRITTGCVTIITNLCTSWRLFQTVSTASDGKTWRTKKDNGLPLNAPISGIDIPSELAEFTDILTQMHKLE